jgi:hypothetical protein
MYTGKQCLSLIGIVFFILILGSIPTNAIRATSITITQGQDTTGNCGQTLGVGDLIFWVNIFGLSGQVDDSSGLDYFLIAIFDSANNVVAVKWDIQAVGSTNHAVGWPVQMDSYFPVSPPSSRLIRAAVIDIPLLLDGADTAPYLDDAPVASGGWIDIGSLSPACAALPAIPPNSTSASLNGITMPPDDRINWQFGDSNVGILYPGHDGAVDLYIYVTGEYIFNFVIPDELAVYEDNPPSTNTLLKQVENISVYILTTGQIQFNFGPDAEGKVWALVLHDLSDRDRSQSYYVDPNE